MAEASYPEGLLYHPEHDWALVDGDIATFGITWFAQEALGEVVAARALGALCEHDAFEVLERGVDVVVDDEVVEEAVVLDFVTGLGEAPLHGGLVLARAAA